jgi:hypothetical protein
MFAERVLINESRTFSKQKKYDIFLSHSFEDAEVILQLKEEIEASGFSVYVDWIEDPQLDRTKVTKKNAAIIRDRLNSCKSLLYAISYNSQKSSWVQWELGLADGQKQGRVAIVPILEFDKPKDFYKQEYLGLYPFIDKEAGLVWVNSTETKYESLGQWLEMINPLSILYS